MLAARGFTGSRRSLPFAATIHRAFGERHDLSDVGAYVGGPATSAAAALGANAYTSGSNIAFAGRPDLRTAAHEAAHVIQQRQGVRLSDGIGRQGDCYERHADAVAALVVAGRSAASLLDQHVALGAPSGTAVQLDPPAAAPARQQAAAVALQDGPDAGTSNGVRDAGVPLPGGLPPGAEELDAARLRDTAPAALADDDLVPAIVAAHGAGDARREASLTEELTRRMNNFGVGLPLALPIDATGSARVTPEIALAMVENMVEGRPPFRPELGVGGVSWFVTEGTPHAGVAADHSVPVEVELNDTQGGLQFEQADLNEIYEVEAARVRPTVEAQVRARFLSRTGSPPPEPLSQTLSDKIEYQVKKLAEREMWTRVAERVAASPRRVGEVILPAGGRFSNAPGRFTLVADAARIRLRGGLAALLRTIRARFPPVSALEQSADELARAMHAAGRVRAVFRVGGKVLIVIGVANDLYQIITADDHLEATVTCVGGWAAASASSAAFAALWTPADAAGPWAWAAHGVGMLVSGGVGYWMGSSVVRYVYRLTVRSSGFIRSP